MARASVSRNWLWPLVLAGLLLAAVAGMCLLGLALLGHSAARTRAAARAAAVHYQENVHYGTADGVPLLMDLARPKSGAGPFPAVVCIHGGGWRGGDRRSFAALAQSLAAQGYVAATISYRFAPDHPFPAQLEDAKCAVRYLRAHARELAVDPQRIGAMGGSAGGHLALLLATTETDDRLEGTGGHAAFSSAVQAAGSIAGPTDLSRPFPPPVERMLADLVGAAREQAPRAFERASPVTYLSPDDPPLLLIHGTRDELVPYEQAASFIEQCAARQVAAQLVTITGGGHGYGGNPQHWQDANRRLVEFFNRHLKQPAQP